MKYDINVYLIPMGFFYGVTRERARCVRMHWLDIFIFLATRNFARIRYNLCVRMKTKIVIKYKRDEIMI